MLTRRRIGIEAGSMKLPLPMLLCCRFIPCVFKVIDNALVEMAVMVVEAIGKDFENGEHLEMIFGVEYPP